MRYLATVVGFFLLLSLLYRVRPVSVLYVVLICPLLFLGRMMWHHKEPPGVAYVTFGLVSAGLAVVVAVDSGWIKRVPPFEWAGQHYGPLQAQVQTLQRNLVGYETQVFRRGQFTVTAGETTKRTLGPAGPTGTTIVEDVKHYRVQFKLAYPAVPDSVLLWEGISLAPPTYFTVEGNVVTIPSAGVNPEVWADDKVGDLEPIQYVIRYFRLPESKPGPAPAH